VDSTGERARSRRIHPRVDDLLYGRFKRLSESDVVPVFLLLGVVWAAVLVPPLLQARREARPIASIRSFRSQLWSLQRATPTYGDAYEGYDDAYADGYADDGASDVHVLPGTGEVAAVYPLAPERRQGRQGRPGVSPGVVGTVVRSADDGVPGGFAGASAIAAQRAYTYRRRRQVLATLFVVAAGTITGAVLAGGPWVVAAGVAGTLLVTYVGLLVRRGRREAERLQKVRYLTPIRAPRPSVVVIGSGAAH
jgi:hypothetical protein